MDYGDLQFEKFEHDPSAFNMKNPKAVGAANKMVS